jgi:uncharacterized protein with PIN domain
MKIIKQGELPEEKEYSATCSNCKTEFEFLRKEGKVHFDQRDGNSVVVKCPLCQKSCWVNM